MKKLGILIFTIGTALVVWNGYSWWSQGHSVTHQPAELKKSHPGWKVSNALEPIQDTDNNILMKNQHSTGDEVGTLEIPRLGTKYPVFWGSDEDTLKQGVGMYDSKWTVTPGKNGHLVLSGHRDTVFKNLDILDSGDHLYVTYNGKIYDYQIRKTWITEKEDRSVIVTKTTPILTLTTCYPFTYIGDAPDRYIIQAELVNVKEA